MTGGESAGLRAALVARLRERGAARSGAVVRAFLAVPRERFVPAAALDEAYADRPIPLKYEHGVAVSTSSQPTMMALMLEQLDVSPGDRVLEIGTGSGYNAALLAELTGPRGFVETLELDPELTSAARSRLSDRPVVRVRQADGDAFEAEQPFDRVIVTAAASDVPPAWHAALGDGGRLVAPVELGTTQVSVALDKVPWGFAGRSAIPALFVPLRGTAPHAVTVVRTGGDRDLVLRLTGGAAPEPRVVAAWLDAGGERSPLGAGCGPADVDDFAVWADGREPGLCSLRGLQRPLGFGPLPTLHDESDALAGMVATVGVAQPESLALLDADAGGLAVRAYGGPEAAAALRRSVTAWLVAGRPRLAALRVDVRYGEGHAGEELRKRPRCALSLRWG